MLYALDQYLYSRYGVSGEDEVRLAIDAIAAARRREPGCKLWGSVEAREIISAWQLGSFVKNLRYQTGRSAPVALIGGDDVSA